METEPPKTEPPETQPPQPPETQPPETEPPETQPPETEPEGDPQAAAFLALLKEEYKSDDAIGLTEKHTYVPFSLLGNKDDYYYLPVDGTIYFFSGRNGKYGFTSAYDVAAKTTTQLDPTTLTDYMDRVYFYLDGYFYGSRDNQKEIVRVNVNGDTASCPGYYYKFFSYGGGFFSSQYDNHSDCVLLSQDLQVIATVPVPRWEAAHGLTEPVNMSYDSSYAAGGMVYCGGYNGSDRNNHMYCLDPAAETPEWTDMGTLSSLPEGFRELADPYNVIQFIGKYGYLSYDGTVYDRTTGEAVYKFDQGYMPATGRGPVYFGGDSVICCNVNNPKDIRWLDLTDGSLSDPLILPEAYNYLYLLDDTTCVYCDQYGIFLWDYTTGEEQTIVMYGQS